MPTQSPVGTLPWALRSVAEQHPQSDALVDHGTRITYSDLHARVVEAARALAALGVQPGDRVCVWGPNSWQWVVLTLAVTYQGAIFVPLNSRYTAHESLDIISRTRASALVVADGFLERAHVDELRTAATETGSSGGAAIDGLPELLAIVRIDVAAPASRDLSGVVEMSDLSEVGARFPVEELERRADAVTPDDVADILFTSGTTGRSKGAKSAHRQTIGVARDWAACGEVTPADRYLLVNPFFHSFGYKAGIVVCLLTGAAMLPQATFQLQETLRLITEDRATIIAGTPPIYQGVLDAPGRAELDLSSLRLAVTGGSVIPVSMVRRVQAELGFEMVLTAFGMTEAVVVTMSRRGDSPELIAGSSGRAVGDFEVRTANPNSNAPLPPGSEGEVLLRGENVMLGYLDDPAATAEAIDTDGWLRTGDVGRLDENGYLTITDRLKDMFIVGGFNVYPAEIEQTVSQLDGVAEIAVVGVPDARLHEVGKVFIVPRPGSDLTSEAVLTHCRERLANFKVPRHVEFVDALPRNASGKVLKRQLK